MQDGPLVAGGVVYVAEGRHVLAFETDCGTGGGTCRPLWHADLPDPVFEPILADGVLYVGSNGGRLYAFDPRCGSGDATCDALWASGRQPDALIPGGVGDGLVFAGTLQATQTPHPGRIYAFRADCADGCEPSRVEAFPGSYVSQPEVDGDLLYVGSATASGGGRIAAYPVRCAATPTCRPTWVDGVSGPANVPHPVAGEGIVVVDSGAGQFTNAYRPECAAVRCSPIWSAFSVGSRGNAPIIAGGLVYVAGGESGLHVYPVDCVPAAGRCAPAWSSAEHLPGASITGVATADGMVYARSFDGTLFALAPRAHAQGGTT
jgi:outer membrane protein assembly factor BamB